jgi:hypothetical protein
MKKLLDFAKLMVMVDLKGELYVERINQIHGQGRHHPRPYDDSYPNLSPENYAIQYRAWRNLDLRTGLIAPAYLLHLTL